MRKPCRTQERPSTQSWQSYALLCIPEETAKGAFFADPSPLTLSLYYSFDYQIIAHLSRLTRSRACAANCPHHDRNATASCLLGASSLPGKLGGQVGSGPRHPRMGHSGSTFEAAPRLSAAIAWPVRAAMTMAPPRNARSLGTSPRASHTQKGPTTVSSSRIRPTSGAGR